MRWVLAFVLFVHGLVHAMGWAKAFGYAELAQLTTPIPPRMGQLWLLAMLLVCGTAVLFALRVSWWYAVGLLALLASQAALVTAWRDAWAGTAANLLLLALIGFAWFNEGPGSPRARFEREAAQAAANAASASAAIVTDADLAHLPAPVQRYLRLAGVVGRPAVRSYRLHFRGRIRSAPDSPWMPFEADQLSTVEPRRRLFLMSARMRGAPVQAFHRLADGHATMRVTLAGIVPIADARGEAMDRSETVTLFNDMCFLAPATLLDRSIGWETLDDRHVRAAFSNGGHTIAATLVFDAEGQLVDFVSDDRSRASADGRTFTRLRFSTPARDYRAFGAARLAGHADARWHLPEGEFTYGEFAITDVAYNAARQGRPGARSL